jgi:hypothetical protein
MGLTESRDENTVIDVYSIQHSCLDSCAVCNDNSEQFGRLRTMESTTEAPLEESVRYVIRDKPSK